jgi:aminoglycoside phosphotransferase (APT) family kinase protein
MTDAEIEITADLVRDLLREQHPDLAGLAACKVPGGWGNQMWRLGDELAVRMQRMDPTPEGQFKEPPQQPHRAVPPGLRLSGC